MPTLRSRASARGCAVRWTADSPFCPLLPWVRSSYQKNHKVVWLGCDHSPCEQELYRGGLLRRMVRSVCEGQVQVDLLGRTLPPVNPHSHNTLTDGHGRASRGARPKTQREGVEMAEGPKLVIQGDDGDGLRFDQWLADILTSCGGYAHPELARLMMERIERREEVRARNLGVRVTRNNVTEPTPGTIAHRVWDIISTACGSRMAPSIGTTF